MKSIKEKMVIGCGVWLIILPYTGFPRSWKSFFTVLTGLVLVYFGALLFRGSRLREQLRAGETKKETFTETI